MNSRILDVNAYTTLDFVEGRVFTPKWNDEGGAVLDVRATGDNPNAIALDIEIDPAALEHVKPHADRVYLSAEQTQSLMTALETVIDDESDGESR